MVDHQIDSFTSPTLGTLNLQGLVDQVVAFIERPSFAESFGRVRENSSLFKIIIGTDSELVGTSRAHFVPAVVVHHVGHGGVYFWGSVTKDNIKTLRQRIYEEATYSLSLAQSILDEFQMRNLPLDKILEIHVDIGPNGETKNLIQEVVGMIKGSGFVCKTKPDSFGASNVADRHT